MTTHEMPEPAEVGKALFDAPVVEYLNQKYLDSYTEEIDANCIARATGGSIVAAYRLGAMHALAEASVGIHLGEHLPPSKAEVDPRNQRQQAAANVAAAKRARE